MSMVNRPHTHPGPRRKGREKRKEQQRRKMEEDRKEREGREGKEKEGGEEKDRKEGKGKGDRKKKKKKERKEGGRRRRAGAARGRQDPGRGRKGRGVAREGVGGRAPARARKARARKARARKARARARKHEHAQGSRPCEGPGRVPRRAAGHRPRHPPRRAAGGTLGSQRAEEQMAPGEWQGSGPTGLRGPQRGAGERAHTETEKAHFPNPRGGQGGLEARGRRARDWGGDRRQGSSTQAHSQQEHWQRQGRSTCTFLFGLLCKLCRLSCNIMQSLCSHCARGDSTLPSPKRP